MLMPPKVKRDLYLQKYIQTRGEFCPDDVDRYVKGGVMEDHCIWCDAHFTERKQSLFPLKFEDVVCIVHICDLCETEADLTELARVNKFSKQIKEVQVNQRILEYARHGKLPLDVDQYATSKGGLCFLCSEKLVAPYKNILIPVGTHHNFNGGEVGVCRICEEISGCDFTQHHEEIDQCSVCFCDYPITTDEAIVRIKRNTMAMHVCPRCWNKPGQPRHQSMPCPECKEETVYLDLSEDRFFRNTGLFSSIPGHVYHRIRCPKCYGEPTAAAGTPFIVSMNEVGSAGDDRKYVVNYKDEIYFVFYKQGQYWNYSVEIWVDHIPEQRQVVSTYISKSITKADEIVFHAVYNIDDSNILNLL